MISANTELMRRMCVEADRRGGVPCGDKATLAECFTAEKGKLMLWYNDKNGSTRMITRELSK